MNFSNCQSLFRNKYISVYIMYPLFIAGLCFTMILLGCSDTTSNKSKSDTAQGENVNSTKPKIKNWFIYGFFTSRAMA